VPMQAQRGDRDIVLESGGCTMPLPSTFTHGQESWYRLYRFWEEKITCPHRGSNLGRPTHSESPYINYLKKDNKLFEGKMVEEPNCLFEWPTDQMHTRKLNW